MSSEAAERLVAGRWTLHTALRRGPTGVIWRATELDAGPPGMRWSWTRWCAGCC